MSEQAKDVLPAPPPVARVVVERLDSLGGQEVQGGLSGSGVVCSVVLDQSELVPASDLLPETILASPASAQEESHEPSLVLDPEHFLNPPATRVIKSMPTLDLSSSSNIIFDDLEPLLDTPTAEKILDNFLAGAEEANMIIQGEEMDDSKWSNSLDDLFPELD